MALLFLFFAIAILLIGLGYRKTGMTIAIINLLLCLAMFFHHVTDILHINL